MAQQPKQSEQIGLVSGPSKEALPQTEDEMAAAEEKAIETADMIGRRVTKLGVKLEDGRSVECRTAKVGHMGLVLRFIKVMAQKMEIVSLEEAYLKAKIENMKDDPLVMLTLLESCEEFVWPVIVALTSFKSEGEAKNMDLDDAAKVAKVLFELNKDFFLTKVLPLLQGSLRLRANAPD